MYQASDKRYASMQYNRCGKSGLLLPAVSLGLWHNFGDTASYETMKQLCFTAFDNGITHFDLANNYGPAPGSAEKNFGSILKDGLGAYRDELLISTKAGYEMWDALTATGAAASICWQASTRAFAAWDWTMWTFFTITGWILTLRWRKRWARWIRR